MVEYRYRKIELKDRKSENDTMWYKKVQEMIKRRKLNIINRRFEVPKITQNVTVIKMG